MDDNKILDLYWARSESAISETREKYHGFLKGISYNILRNHEDSDECVNDTYLKAWDTIPPKRPNVFSAFLGKITRNLSLNRYEKLRALKRGGGETEIVLSELEECIPSFENTEGYILQKELTEKVDRFLESLPKKYRKIFVRRYWYLSSVKEISNEYGISEGNIRVSLHRMRIKLREFLLNEGVL